MKFCHLAAAVLLLTPTLASAGEWDLDVSGHAQGLYGYSDVSKRFEKKDRNNHGTGQADINVSAAYTFDDNDYSFSLNLDLMGGIDQELQDYNQGRWGEEAYLIADSPYGRLMLGQTFNVDAQFHEAAPEVGAVRIENSDVVDFITNPNWKRNGKTTKFATLNTTYINTDGVAPKVSYISPEFYNSMFGFTYVPDAYNRRGLINKFASYHQDDGYIASLYTKQDLGFADLSGSIGYALFHKDDNEFSASLRLARGGWTLGGGWRKTYVDGSEGISQIAPTAQMPEFFDGYREGHAWNVGVGYEIGPYQVALSYFESAADNSDNCDKIVVFSNQYQVNKYLDVYLAAAHVDFSGADSHNVYDNNKGYAFVTGLGLNF